MSSWTPAHLLLTAFPQDSWPPAAAPREPSPRLRWGQGPGVGLLGEGLSYTLPGHLGVPWPDAVNELGSTHHTSTGMMGLGTVRD